jgi:hypothetical protein
VILAPVHPSGHHRDTDAQIFKYPTGHNIGWQAVDSLLGAVAEVDETHDGKRQVTLESETEIFEPPRHRDIESQQVVDRRRKLNVGGYGPDMSTGESCRPS